MFALRTVNGGRANRAGAAGVDRFVLPRSLRRPARVFARLGTGDFVPPRFAATMISAALFAAAGLYGAYLGGLMPEVAQAVTARTGFAVDQVRVVGHRETSEIDVLEKLDLSGWTSLIGFDVDKARDRVAELPWVEGASVRKVYPEMLEVRIQERVPFAIWQHGGELSIIGAAGNVIVPFTGGRHAGLPLVVGAGAAERAKDFVDKIARFPSIAARVKGYVLVSQRRWNLFLDNGLTVKLPAQGEDAALAALVDMARDKDLFRRDVASVDMRLADRVVVRLSTEAMEAREASLKKGGSKKAKPEKRI
ncbi:MAG: cell division protein FtsQ/DivIB [Rhizobiaceae bacterium]|nr:cell division protein FtsQ/DivIB [Rhizobiaceae bacterium]